MRIKITDSLNFRWDRGYFWYDRKNKEYCRVLDRFDIFKPKEIDNNGKQISSKDYQFRNGTS
tara:strand:- start:194 stop:379 length:186 start_codon:yes stop_codon:yes gene_type:complete